MLYVIATNNKSFVAENFLSGNWQKNVFHFLLQALDYAAIPNFSMIPVLIPWFYIFLHTSLGFQMCFKKSCVYTCETTKTDNIYIIILLYSIDIYLITTHFFCIPTKKNFYERSFMLTKRKSEKWYLINTRYWSQLQALFFNNGCSVVPVRPWHV